MAGNPIPLQVYLDSGDYSALSRPSKTAELQAIETELIAMQADGHIQMRYSHLHVIEAAPVDKASIQFAEARFQKIQSLCGSRCFASALSIIEEEVRHPGEMKPYRENQLHRDDGNWLPDRLATRFSKRSAVERIEIKAASLSRDARRKYLGESFDSKKNPKPKVLDQLQIPDRLLPDWNKAGITDREIIEPLLDLSKFIDLYKRQWSSANEFSAWLRKCGRTVLDSSRRVTGAMQPARDLLTGPNEKLAALLPRVVFEEMAPVRRSRYADLVRDFAKSLGVAPLHCEFSDAMTLRPATAVFVTMQFEILRRQAAFPSKKNEPLASDFGDALHCAYIPYVDIFRPDTETGKALFDAKLPFPTRIVSKLVDLPDVIREELNTRQNRSAT